MERRRFEQHQLEELIRRFNEENNEEAGQHFTPCDVVKLMADLILLPIAEKIESATYLLTFRAFLLVSLKLKKL